MFYLHKTFDATIDIGSMGFEKFVVQCGLFSGSHER